MRAKPVSPIGERICLTVPEAARVLRISRNFCYELVRQGVLPSVRLGKRILIPRVRLEKVLAEGGSLDEGTR